MKNTFNFNIKPQSNNQKHFNEKHLKAMADLIDKELGNHNENLESLKDSELNQKVKSLAAEERKLTKEILLHIAEVDKRRLYLRMAYPSLFDYLTKEIGYSFGAAQRRIDAARLMHKVPEVSASIEEGKLHLSQISKVQRVCRHLKKESGMAVEVARQKAVLKKLENKTSDQTDLILAEEFQVEIKTKDKKVIQRDESVRIEFTLTKEEMELLKRAQELLSNKTGGGLKETLVEMAERTVKAYDSKSKEKATSTATVAVEKKTNSKKMKGEKRSHEDRAIKELKSMTPKLRKQIIERDQCCQFKDPQTGKICGSKHFLEVDHIRPKHQQGPNTAENLRALCKNHNLYRYSAQYRHSVGI